MNEHRRTALAVALALLLLPGLLHAEVTVTEEGGSWVERLVEELAAEPGGRLELRADKGAVSVDSWDRPQVRVLVEKRADVFTESEARRMFEDFAVTVRQDADFVAVEAHAGRGRRSARLDIAFRITVPERFAVDVDTDGGSVEIGRLQGDVAVETAGGEITVGTVVDGSVSVKTSGGSIRIGAIEGGDGVAKTLGGNVQVDRASGALQLDTKGGNITVGSVGGNLTAETLGGSIEVGTGGPVVEARTSGGSIKVGEAAGTVDASTLGGNITVGHAGGAVAVETSGGTIRVESAGGAVRAATLGGGIRVLGSGGPVTVRTRGGNIDIEDARGYIEAQTAGGDIRAELLLHARDADTHCTLETAGGDLSLRLPPELAATIDAEIELESRSRRDLEISADFPLEIETSARRITGRGTLNGGGDLIKLRTSNGNIRLSTR